MDKPTPSDKSTDRKPRYYISPEKLAAQVEKNRLAEIEEGKKIVDKNGKPVLVVDRPIDL